MGTLVFVLWGLAGASMASESEEESGTQMGGTATWRAIGAGYNSVDCTIQPDDTLKCHDSCPPGLICAELIEPDGSSSGICCIPPNKEGSSDSAACETQVNLGPRGAPDEVGGSGENGVGDVAEAWE